MENKKGVSAVSKWRQNTKQRMIDSMGGKCQICGYSKCNESLTFHHLDPTQKDFSLASIRANPKSWLSIVQELKKCILLCHNCHFEIHSGITNLPNSFNTFDESFLDYKNRNKSLTPCLVCNKLKEDHKKYCSRSCAGKSKIYISVV